MGDLSYTTKLMCGITLISIPTIEYGGYFLLGILTARYPNLALTQFQQAFFRAGHAHAGVLVILSLICQILVDHAALTPGWQWAVRIGVIAAALLVSGGFFGSAVGAGLNQPNRLIIVLYIGIIVLAFSVVTLGIGLIRSR
jgi:hypothetical protein